MRRRKHTVQRLYAQYHRYRRKLERILSGRSRYARKDLLLKRLQRIQRQLMDVVERHRLVSVKLGVSAGIMIAATTFSTGQSLSLKTDNPLQLAHIEGNARPVLLDWDADGDLDLFVGGQLITAIDSSSAGVAYYQNDNGAFNQAPSPFPESMMIDGVGNDPDSVNVNLAFIDLDGDGDQDAFAGQSNGTMLYYRNDDGAFTKGDASENPFHGIQIGGQSHASPTFVDVDGDGDLDAVIGKYDGLISYYVNNGDGTFTEQTNGASDPNPFGDVNVTENASPVFADWDGDGDLDLLVGNKAGELAYFRNDDGAFIALDATENPFADLSYENDAAPTVGDVDGDGDLDLIVGDDFGDLFYIENDEGALAEIPRNTIGLGGDLSLSSSHAFTDIDADGDEDLVRGSFEGTLAVLENTDGVFALAETNPLDTPAVMVGYISQPAFADIDGDGDEDLFLGSYQNDIQYHSNDGGVFTQVEGEGNPFNGINAGDNESISFVDLDGDGDLDAIIGNKMGQVKYFENTDGVFAEAPASNPFEGISFEVAGNPNHPVQTAFADIDGDGDMDGYFGLIDGNMRVFENMGDVGRNSSVTFTELTGEDNPFNGMDFGRSASPAFGDIDGDGDMDLIITNAAGLSFHFENAGSTASPTNQLNSETHLYPNPTEGMFTIELPWINDHAQLQVFDVAGKLLAEKQTRISINQLNISNLPAGVYFLKITAAEGQAVKKIWKQ